MSRTRTRASALTLGGIGLAAVLAACAPAAEPDVEDPTSDTAEEPTSETVEEPTEQADDATTPAEDGSGYADGTYSATGQYRSPNGGESIDVELTLESGVVTDVVVDPTASSPTSQMFQTLFSDSIAYEVVGKDIDELDVSRVAGSSLTSGGFNDALEQIKADAAA